MNKKINVKTKKTMVKTVKFNADEIRTIEQKAKERELSISAYIRDTALSGVMSEEYYERQYLKALVPLTQSVNNLKKLINDDNLDINKLKTNIYDMDKEILKLWHY